MTLDLSLLGDKLQKYRLNLQCTLSEIESATGLSADRLQAFEDGQIQPSGDEILILSDYYKCDYQFFISNERLAVFEQTETLFRKYGDELSKEDRWIIQEFMFICECEQFLEEELGRTTGKRAFEFKKTTTHHKSNAIQAAPALRKHLSYSYNQALGNIYDDFRNIGLHIFRRKLQNSGISGLFILHPTAGKCILVNYEEDIYRQRFTLAHEVSHAILDAEDKIVLSLKTKNNEYKEIAANTFASRFLIPLELLNQFKGSWNKELIIEWANKLQVSAHAFSIALKDSGLITQQELNIYKSLKIPKQNKKDPELPEDLSAGSIKRQKYFLEKGLSIYYVSLCFDAYEAGIISYGRLAEMLLSDHTGIHEITKLINRTVHYAD